MLPRRHALIGFLLSSFIYFTFQVNFLKVTILFFSSFLIDFDHYLYYIYKKRNFSVKNAYWWFREKEDKYKRKISKKKKKRIRRGFYCFHGLEWVLLFILLGKIINSLFYFISFGMLLHLFLDWVDLINKNHALHKISVIYDFIKKDNLKKI